MSALRVVAFGDLGAPIWGLAWAHGANATVAIGAEREVVVESGRLDAGGTDIAWTLRHEGLELEIEPAGDALGSGSEAFDQLCRASGRLTLADTARDADCPGVRMTRTDLPGGDGLGSMRLVAAWFEHGEGLAVVSARPAGTEGHDQDVVTASVFEAERQIAASEPRLSTTYDSTGTPARVGLELWIGAESDSEDAEPQEYPYRAAGEAIGVPARFGDGDLELQALPLSLHARGHEGRGVYLLVSRPGAA